MLFSSGKIKKNVDCSDETIRAGLIEKNGNPTREAAIKCLYFTCLPSVKSMVLKNSGTEQDAEDLFQDALCILLRNIDLLEKEVTGSPQAYLRSIARRQWLNVLRARHSQARRTKLEDGGESDEPASVAEFMERERLFEAQEACMTQMTPKCQAILESIYTDDRQSMDIVAAQQELANAHTARQTKYRCLQNLKTCILKRLTMTDDDHESTI